MMFEWIAFSKVIYCNEMISSDSRHKYYCIYMFQVGSCNCYINATLKLEADLEEASTVPLFGTSRWQTSFLHPPSLPQQDFSSL